jgi:hypothetical protein
MHFPSISIVPLFYLMSCAIPVITMRLVSHSDWQFPWPDAFKDKRLELHESATVYAWPSTGGRFELQNPSAFELDYLGIEDHSAESNNSADTTEEDAFVRRLRHLGGTFYEYQYGTRRNEDRQAELLTWLGWPEDEEHKGGVWVLKVKRSETFKVMTGRIRLAKTMQDRCRMIEICGGVFYASPTEEQLVPMEPVPHLSRVEAQEQERRLRDARLRYDI